MDRLIEILRRRLMDLPIMEVLPDSKTAFEDSYLSGVLSDSLDQQGYEIPLPSKQHEQLIAIDAAMIVVTGLKAWSDGESYSYKSDAVQVTRGLMPRHFKDTISILKNQRDEIVERMVSEL